MEKITIYTQPDCPPCEVTKMFLSEHGFSFDLKNIKTDKKAKDELTKKYQSYSTPTIVIGETVITGFNLEKLKETLNITE